MSGTDRERWLEHLQQEGFPRDEYRSEGVPFERWSELAQWHERLRRKWNERQEVE